jgi:hypothetical protein
VRYDEESGASVVEEDEHTFVSLDPDAEVVELG